MMCIITYETSLYRQFDAHANSLDLACSLLWGSHPMPTLWLRPKIVAAERPALSVSPMSQEIPLGHRDTWVARATISWTAMYELLHWFELELTDRAIADRLALEYQQVHRFFHRLRDAIVAHENRSIHLLNGEVEVDETDGGANFGHRKRAVRDALRKTGQVKRGRGAKELQQPVFGIYERADGIVYVKPVDDVSKKTLHRIITGKVTLETTMYSDTWKGYHQLDQTFEAHHRVNHSQHEYVRGVRPRSTALKASGAI